MAHVNYQQRRQQIEHYFDRTAADVWATDLRRARERHSRNGARGSRGNAKYLAELVARGLVRSAGVGCGLWHWRYLIELAKRGAEVIAVDLSQSLIELANERYSAMDEYHRIQFIVGDMRQLEGERFDHVLAMDSIIHYAAQDGLRTLETLADSVDDRWYSLSHPRPCRSRRCTRRKVFPRSDRAPAIEPIAPAVLLRSLDQSSELTDWMVGREHRVSTGFYTSQAMELVREC